MSIRFPPQTWKGFDLPCFTYYTPIKVVFGKETENSTGALVKAFGGQKGSAKLLKQEDMANIYRLSR